MVVGNELLSGHTRDENGPFLARRLREVGHRVVRISIVPDEEGEIVEALAEASGRAGLVFTTGGLGPTGDDVTIDAVAAFLDRPLRRPPEAEEQIRRIYRRGKDEGLLESSEVDERAWRMARVPEGATVVRNDAGAAPGCVLEAEGVRVVALPGPPRELRSVMGHVIDRGLVPRGEPSATREVVLDTFEAPVSGDLEALAREHPDVEVGSYPQAGRRRVLVRLVGSQRAVEAAREALVDRVGELVLSSAGGGGE